MTPCKQVMDTYNLFIVDFYTWKLYPNTENCW